MKKNETLYVSIIETPSREVFTLEHYEDEDITIYEDIEEGSKVLVTMPSDSYMRMCRAFDSWGIPDPDMMRGAEFERFYDAYQMDEDGSVMREVRDRLYSRS